MEIRQIKDELKDMFPEYKGFIEHTLVAKMCKEWHEKQVKNCYIADVSDCLKAPF